MSLPSPSKKSHTTMIRSICLILAIFFCVNANQADAQFRFKSSFGQQSSRTRATNNRATNNRATTSSNRSLTQKRTVSPRNTTRTITKSNQPTSHTRKTTSNNSRITGRFLQDRGRKTNSSKTTNRTQTNGNKIVNSPVIKSQTKSTRENWSRADQILKNSQKSSSRNSAKKSGSLFSKEAIAEAKKSRSGIFPGERPTGNPTSSKNKTPISLSDAIADRLSGRNPRQDKEDIKNDKKESPADDKGRTPIGNGSILDGIGKNPGRGEDANNTEENAPADDPTSNVEQEGNTDPHQNADEEETMVEENANEEPLDPGYNNQPEEVQEEDCKQKVRDIVFSVLDRVATTRPIVVESTTIVSPVETAPAAPATPVRKIRTDLEIVGVKFVDYGSEKDNTGPKFKIQVRNHNNKFATEEVSVAVIAAIDVNNDNLGRTAAMATIESIAPRGVSEVEVQLSREAYELMSGDGQTAIFSELAVIVDPDQKFTDVRPDNNVLVNSIDDIEMDE